MVIIEVLRFILCLLVFTLKIGPPDNEGFGTENIVAGNCVHSMVKIYEHFRLFEMCNIKNLFKIANGGRFLNDYYCDMERPYACEKNATITTTPAPAPICALGWTGFNGHCYQHFYNSSLTSFAANDACNNLDGYLLKIDNDAELDFLIAYITRRIGESIFVKQNI